jgi:wyosine [tRNA(Phe)-imidazoG37] synthetase (radical SAM superfamily)
MPTFLFDDFVFGPIKSRRLGSSLGINLLSVNQKVCNFDCIYCECGETKPLTKEKSVFVAKKELFELLTAKLIQCRQENTPIDTITFAGNGEPTLHPHFFAIVQNVIELRNTYFPKAAIAVLTNGYSLDKKRVEEALTLVDKAIVKLDAGEDHLLKLVDRPKGNLSLNRLIKNIQRFPGNLIIQSMFLKGLVGDIAFDNSTGRAINQWLIKIERLHPSEVMLYSLDRDTPIKSLELIPKVTLERIAKRVRLLGIKALVV